MGRQWEYLVIEEILGDVFYTTDSGEKANLPLQDYLNFFGERGWEVVVAIPRQDGDPVTSSTSTIILKRPTS